MQEDCLDGEEGESETKWHGFLTEGGVEGGDGRVESSEGGSEWCDERERDITHSVEGVGGEEGRVEC